MAEETRNAKLRLGVETKGVDKSINDLKGIDREIDKLTKDIRQNFDKSVNSVEKLTDEIRGDLVSAIKEADKAADGIDIKSGGSSGGGGNAPAAAKFRGAASLVGGGELVGLIDDFQDLGEGLVELKNSAPGAAQGLFSLAASMGPAGLLAAGAAAVAVVALGAVLKTFADERAKEAETVRSIIEANKNARQKVDEGATTKDITKEIERLGAARKREADQIAQNARLYEENFMKDGFVDAAATLLSTVDDELATSTASATKAVEGIDTEMAALELTLKDGSAAANDAAEAERKLAAERTQAVLDSATAAGQEVAAKRRADDASYESNLARIESIDDERAAIEAQIEVLKSSGDTSETVTGQIEKLTSQLGALGSEADYIKSTALEATKRRDEEKKAAKQAEENAKKAADAQQKYADGIKNANLALKQATADINTKLKQGLADNLESMFRDVTDIATQYRRDTFDMDLKANQAERDALSEHYRDIDDIQNDALKSEQEALREGDFKAAFLAKQAGVDALKQEQKETLRERSDRTQSLSDERADLLRNAQQTRSDRMLALERQNIDSRTAAQRELQQAKLTRTRALEMNSASYKAELASLGVFLQQRNKLLTDANQQVLAGMGSGGRSGGRGGGERAAQQQISRVVGSIMRR